MWTQTARVAEETKIPVQGVIFAWITSDDVCSSFSSVLLRSLQWVPRTSPGLQAPMAPCWVSSCEISASSRTKLHLRGSWQSSLPIFAPPLVTWLLILIAFWAGGLQSIPRKCCCSWGLLYPNKECNDGGSLQSSPWYLQASGSCDYEKWWVYSAWLAEINIKFAWSQFFVPFFNRKRCLP